MIALEAIAERLVTTSAKAPAKTLLFSSIIEVVVAVIVVIVVGVGLLLFLVPPYCHEDEAK